mgnify:CR=1 FL=1
MGRKIPPRTVDQLKFDQTVDETDAHADESNDYETKNQRIARNRADIRSDPANGRSDKRGNVTHKIAESVSSSSALKNHTFLKI